MFRSKIFYEDVQYSLTLLISTKFFTFRFPWGELRGKTDSFGDSIQEALIELGWEQPMWDERVDQIPKSECMGWTELSADKQWAIGVLGYTELKWDAYPTDPRCIADDST